MKKIFQLLMVILGYAPIASISVAAHAKASELKGEDQPAVLRKQLQAARNRLMPLGYSHFSVDQAMDRSAAITGLLGAELEESIRRDIQLLMDQGILEVKENMLISGVQSQFH